MDHSLIKKDTCEAHESLLDPLLILDILSLALYIEDILIKLMILQRLV